MIYLARKLRNVDFKSDSRFSFFKGWNSVSDRVFVLFYFFRYRDMFVEQIRFSSLVLILITSMFANGYCQAQQTTSTGSVVWYDYEVVNVFPHDPKAFTQGLIFLNGFLYESTGLNGYSSIRKVRLLTGEVLQTRQLPAQFFAEGLTNWSEALVQLTWRSGLGFVYDLVSMRVEQTFSYAGEGWGLTQDGDRLILSDGTSSVRFLDPSTFRETGRLAVTDSGRPVNHLNELEMVNGRLFANVWKKNYIVMIDLVDGTVIGKVDLTGILMRHTAGKTTDVLNGIAYDAGQDRLFVTGKLWPVLFEIRIIPRN